MILHLLNVSKRVLIEPFVPDRPVVAFDIGVLLRLAGLNVLKDDAMTSKPTLYESVTQWIIIAIEANPGKPAMPWHRDAKAPLFMPANALTRNAYNGINTLVLWVSAEQQGYTNPVWGTYRQWVRRVSRMKGVTSWVREQCPALSPHPACHAGNGMV